MTSHTIDDSRYNGEFKTVLKAYRENDSSITSLCEKQASRVMLHRREAVKDRDHGHEDFGGLVQINMGIGRSISHARSAFVLLQLGLTKTVASIC